MREDWFAKHCEGTAALREASRILGGVARNLHAVGLDRVADQVARAAELTEFGHEQVSDAVGEKVVGDASREHERAANMVAAVIGVAGNAQPQNQNNQLRRQA